MKRIANKILWIVGLACALASCTEEEMVLSLTLEETTATVTGTWVVDAAGKVASTDAGEEHVTDHFQSALESVDITAETLTFHFNRPVQVRYETYDVADPWNPAVARDEVTEYTVQHTDYVTMENVYIGTETDGKPFFTVYRYPSELEEQQAWDGHMYMWLYGSSKDEETATEILLAFSADPNADVYSLVRKK